MTYFEKCTNKEEIKKEYKKLVKKYHPDVFGPKGNEILKEINAEFEEVLKKQNEYDGLFDDEVESDADRNKKLKIVKYLFEKYGVDGWQGLIFYYWQAGLRFYKHRNPLTNHAFSGNNIFICEFNMLLKDWNSCNWSTFAQYKKDKQIIAKGEHGTVLTLAMVGKNKKDDEEETYIYYRSYVVFNECQLKTNVEQLKLLEVA